MSARRLSAALLVLAGCTAVDLKAPRAYPCAADAECRGGWVCGLEGTCHAPEAGAWRCEADGGDGRCFGWRCGLDGRCHDPALGAPLPCDVVREDAGLRRDCPTAWRCGLENTCHSVGDAQPWRCAAEADCEGGWHCGLEGVCYSKAQGVPRPCALAAERDGGRADCPTGWRCGLEDVCHAVGDTQAWRCGDDRDCEGGWRCGLEGFCYSKAVAAPRPCELGAERDGGRADCPTGWRCGLENVCHAVGDPRAWRCDDDRDCEGGWRCGPARVCMNPTLEQPVLRPDGGAAALRFDRLTVELAQGAELVAGENLRTDNRFNVAWSRGAQVSRFDHRPSFGPFDGGLYALGTVTLRARPDALAVAQGVGYALFDSGLTALTWAVDGGLVAQDDAVALGFVPAGLVGGFGAAWAWDADRLVRVVAMDAGFAVEPQALDAGRVLGVDSPVVDLSSSLVAPTFVLTEQALLQRTENGAPSWTRATLKGADGGEPPLGPGEAQAVYVAPGVVGLWAVDAGLGIYQPGTSELRAPGGPCRPCGADAPLRLVALSNPVLTAACPSDAGAQWTSLRVTDCQRVAGPTGEPQLQVSRLGHLFAVDGRGRLLQGSSLSPLSGGASPSRTLAAPLLGVSSGGRTLFAGAALTPVGLLSANPSLSGVALTGEPALTVSTNGVSDHWTRLQGGTDVQLVGLPDTSGSVFPVPPQRGLLVADGARRWALVAVGDALWAADVAESLALARDGGTSGAVGSRAARLQPRLVPSPGLPVLGLVAEGGSVDAGTLLAGWALNGNRATYFEALSERAWVDTPVNLPRGDWFALLGEPGRWRVAYRDGTLYTLPSRLLVAEPLPGGAQAGSVVTALGLDFAASDAGVFVLGANPDGGVVGTWQRLVLPLAQLSGLPQDDYAAVQLLAREDDLLVLTKYFEVVRVRRAP